MKYYITLFIMCIMFITCFGWIQPCSSLERMGFSMIPPDDGMRTCDKCNGQMVKCMRCQGHGHDLSKRKCVKCNGTKTVHIKCDKCKSTGKVKKEMLETNKRKKPVSTK